MKNITVIEGDDLDFFARVLGIAPELSRSIYRIRIANEAGGIKVKINEGMWTPAMGKANT